MSVRSAKLDSLNAAVYVSQTVDYTHSHPTKDTSETKKYSMKNI